MGSAEIIAAGPVSIYRVNYNWLTLSRQTAKIKAQTDVLIFFAVFIG
jgi:hypothetical protein